MNAGTAGSSFEASASFHPHSTADNLFRFCREKPLGALAAILLLVLVLAATFAETLATHDPIRTDAEHTLARPEYAHWFGTDNLGRDIYSRIIYGARISLAVGIASTLLGAAFGGIIGVISGYWGGWLDLRTQRVIRGSVIAIREFAYIEAARALGVGHSRIAFRHVLPNTVGPFIVLMTAQFGGAILVEAALSFLGLGIPEPYPSWGRMLSVSAAEFAQKAPWLVLFPGIAISLVVFASNLLGDAVRDKLNPRLRGA